MQLSSRKKQALDDGNPLKKDMARGRFRKVQDRSSPRADCQATGESPRWHDPTHHEILGCTGSRPNIMGTIDRRGRQPAAATNVA
jgi:hypothetical protein